MFRVPHLASRFPLLLLAAIPLTAVGAADSNAHRPRGVNWSDTLWIPAYDPALGVPRGVALRYQRWTMAQARAENTTPAPCGVMFTHWVHLRLAQENGQTLDISERSGVESDYLTAFDGVVDYGGDSGCVLGPLGLEARLLYFDDAEQITYFDRPSGLVPLTFTAMGEGFLSAPEGTLSEIDMSVGVRVVVEYLYDS